MSSWLSLLRVALFSSAPILTLTATAQDTSSASGAPPASSAVIKENIPYTTVNGVALTLNLYLPADTSKTPPVLIWIHGGGWDSGSKKFPKATYFINAGLAVASIDYRFSQVAIFPAQIFDCKAAIRWVRANAASYHLDPKNIVVMGASAGGHLAGLVGVTNDQPAYEGDEAPTGVSSRVQGACVFSGLFDFTTIEAQHQGMPVHAGNEVPALFGGTLADKADLIRMGSPALQISKESACPFLVVCGGADPLVPPAQSKEFDAALKAAGVSSTLMVLPGVGHGSLQDASAAQAIALIRQWTGFR